MRQVYAPQTPLEAAVLFAGMGGSSRGMKQAGLKVVKSYDWSKQEVEAHLWLEPDIPCEQRDVSTVEPEELRGLFVWASPSCKPYSLANRTPKRGKLHPEYYSLAGLVYQLRYAAVAVIENVTGLLWSADAKTEMAALNRACAELGISKAVYVLASNEFGVRQYRRRAFILLHAPHILFSRAVPIVAEHAVMATEHRGQFQAGKHSSFNARSSRHGRSLEICAELQGLPIPPNVPRTVAHRLLGNAVPPLLSKAVCEAVLRSMVCEVAA